LDCHFLIHGQWFLVRIPLSPWQDGNIVELNDAGEWFVNSPDIAFNDIGDLLDAEEAMFQEMQEGWISYEEFEAFENYVKGNVWGVNKPLSSIIQLNNVTVLPWAKGLGGGGVLINSNNQALSVAQLQALDTNNDGQLTGSETNILRLWQDINEDGHLDTGELANLNTLNHPIQQSEYAFYTNFC
jgi:hypothetical protein